MAPFEQESDRIIRETIVEGLHSIQKKFPKKIRESRGKKRLRWSLVQENERIISWNDCGTSSECPVQQNFPMKVDTKSAPFEKMMAR